MHRLTCIVLLGACSMPGPAADDETPEIVVAATRTRRPEASTPNHTSTVEHGDVVQRQSRTAPQALAEEPGILIQETNLGGGSPFIRGLTGSQILVLVEGVRINNSAFSRFGPNQYMNTVDPFSIDRMEVVRGPGSVLYGSDALGGVVSIGTLDRDESLEHTISTYLRYGSAAIEKTVAVRGQGGNETWSAAGGGLFQDFDDLRGGRDTGVQAPTGYSAGAADFKLNYSPNEVHTFTAALQYFEASDVPRTDRITSGRNALFLFDPQRRELFYLRWRAELDGAVDSVQATVSYHRQTEGRKEIRTSAPDALRSLYDSVGTLGVTVHATKRYGRHRVTAGAEYYGDDVSSARTDFTAGDPPEAKMGRFPDGATYRSIGIFVQDEIDVGDLWDLVLGLRYSYFRWDATVADPIGLVQGDADDVTFSIGASRRLGRFTHIYGQIATGFRAPNLDDLTIFDSFGSGIEVPNPNLDPETSLNYELGFKLRRPRHSATVALFYSDFDNLIQRVNTGETMDGEAVFTRENVGRARIFGFELAGRTRIGDGPLSVHGNLAWVQGDDLTNDVPLRRIPPLVGLVSLRYEDSTGRFFVELYTRFHGEQSRLSPGDIDDPRIPDGGTKAWATLNLRGTIFVSDGWTLVSAIENIFDKTYRVHGSGIDAPGTNFLLTVEKDF